MWTVAPWIAAAALIAALPSSLRAQVPASPPSQSSPAADQSPNPPAAPTTAPPQTTAPQTATPQSTTPQTTAPQTATPQTTTPQTTTPPATPQLPPPAAPTEPGPSQSATPPPPKISPAQHLANGQATLARIPDSVATRSEARRALAELRKDYAQLMTTYKPSDAGWPPILYDVERDLVLLIGGGGPGLPDSKTLAAKSEVSDPAARDALKTLRTEVELFYDTAMATVQ